MKNHRRTRSGKSINTTYADPSDEEQRPVPGSGRKASKRGRGAVESDEPYQEGGSEVGGAVKKAKRAEKGDKGMGKGMVDNFSCLFGLAC